MMPNKKRSGENERCDSRHWWQHPAAKWAGIAVATPVLVGVLIWGAQQAITYFTKPFDRGAPTVPKLVRLERSEFEHEGNWAFRDAVKMTTRELDQLNALPLWSEAEAKWFRRRGAVDPGTSIIKLVLKGNRNDPIRIVGMKAIPKCQDPLTGTLFLSPSAGAGESEGIQFDLDTPDPRAQLVRSDGTSGDYFTEKTVTLKRDEDITFQINARTEKQYCEFTLAMDVLTGLGVVTQDIDNSGEPFRVTAMVNAQAYETLYISGLADPPNYPDSWRQVDPRTYNP